MPQADNPRQATQSPTIGGVVVAVEDQGLAPTASSQQRHEQRRDGVLDRLGIGSTECVLELGATLVLERSHCALSPQRAIREVIEEPALRADGEIDMEGEVLGELERLEAVEDQRFAEYEITGEVRVEEETVTAQASEEAADGRVAGAEGAGDLTERGTFAGQCGDGA